MHIDYRYDVVKALIEAGNINSFSEIFQFIPKSTVYKDLGVNFNRFDRAILNPAIFRIQELFQLAEMFEIDPKKFVEMAFEQAIAFKNKKRQGRKRPHE